MWQNQKTMQKTTDEFCPIDEPDLNCVQNGPKMAKFTVDDEYLAKLEAEIKV